MKKYTLNLKQCTEWGGGQIALDYIKNNYGEGDFHVIDIAKYNFNLALWLLWHLDRPLLIDLNCDYAERMLHFYKQANLDDARVRPCVDVTRRWNRGEITEDSARDTIRAVAGDKAWDVWSAQYAK